jgi:hypothetical protein
LLLPSVVQQSTIVSMSAEAVVLTRSITACGGPAFSVMTHVVVLSKRSSLIGVHGPGTASSAMQ